MSASSAVHHALHRMQKWSTFVKLVTEIKVVHFMDQWTVLFLTKPEHTRPRPTDLGQRQGRHIMQSLTIKDEVVKSCFSSTLKGRSHCVRRRITYVALYVRTSLHCAHTQPRTQLIDVKYVVPPASEHS